MKLKKNKSKETTFEKFQKSHLVVSKRNTIITLSLAGALVAGGATAAGVLGYKATHTKTQDSSQFLNTLMYGFDKISNFSVNITKERFQTNDKKEILYSKYNNKEKISGDESNGGTGVTMKILNDGFYYSVDYIEADETKLYTSKVEQSNYSLYYETVFDEYFDQIGYDFGTFTYKDGKYVKNHNSYDDESFEIYYIETKNDKIDSIVIEEFEDPEHTDLYKKTTMKYSYNENDKELFDDPIVTNFNNIKCARTDLGNNEYEYSFTFYDGPGDDEEKWELVSNPIYNKIYAETSSTGVTIVENCKDKIKIRLESGVTYFYIDFNCCGSYTYDSL